MAFSGFPKEGISWFQGLALTQTREWFAENREAYELLWVQPMTALLSELEKPLSRVYGRTVAAGKIFRIYRDVRFAKDKTPYKTHIAAVMKFDGAASMEGPAALYLQLGLQEFAGMGSYYLEAPQLKRFRALVLDEKEGPKVQKLVDGAAKAGLSLDGIEKLKRVPPGVAKDHPRGELLRFKGLAVGTDSIPASVRYSPKLKDWLVEEARAAMPLVKWAIAQKLA